MRIGLTLNSKQQYIASVPGPGHLGAHLSLSQRPPSGEAKRRVRITGHDNASGTESVMLSWPEIELVPGDVVELTVLDEGAGSPPVLERRSSQNPANLFSSVDLAAEALALGVEFEKKLLSFLRKAESEETADEFGKIRLATGHLLSALGDHLYSPIWRRHSSLVPPEMHGHTL
jgi:hypothetical protein